MSGYAITRLDEIEEVTDGREPWRAVRAKLGITAFGVNAWTGKNAGDRIINEHDESNDGDEHEELYFVSEGRARFEIDGEQVDAPAGTFVFVQPSARRTAFAEEPGTTLVAVGGTRGKAYEVSGWEVWMPIHRLYQEGEYVEAAERGRELVAGGADYPLVLYNLACCESLAGQKDEAIEHLRRSLELSPERLRPLLATDTDLDPLREEPAFRQVAGEHG